MISSAHNPRIRQIRLLMEKSRERKEKGLFVIEGVRELEIALQSGFTVHSLFICTPILSNPARAAFFTAKAPVVEEIDPVLYERLAYRGSTEGVLAIMYSRSPALEDIILSASPLVIILESVEKPGNLGAILRTADACGVDAVLVCDPLTDLYNPNTIRASLGCLFSVPTLSCSSEEAHGWLNQNNIQIIAASCQSSVPYHLQDYSGPTALAMGTEDKGLSSFWNERARLKVNIPMRGKTDSLNVSVATAVLCFEVIRQRNS